SGNAPVSGTLFHFDPAAVKNGVYQLRLTATDVSGRTSTAAIVVDANTAAKSFDYVRSDTDLSVSLGGVTVNLVRTYDSLSRNVAGSIGNGWRLANIDTDIQTSVLPTGREEFGTYNPFTEGTRVYLTLPNGQRIGFTFTPEKHLQSGATYYTPEFQADPGVAYQLESAGAVLSRGPNGFYDVETARPYNPASGGFSGPDYTLTGPDGTIYHLSTANGVEDEIHPGGGTLHFSGSGITSSTGQPVPFLRAAARPVTSVTPPDA